MSGHSGCEKSVLDCRATCQNSPLHFAVLGLGLEEHTLDDWDVGSRV